MKRVIYSLLSCSLLALSGFAFAQQYNSADEYAPVVDVGSANQSMPLPQRIDRLENQVNNLSQMNLMQKINQLQGEIQQLRGQIEIQNHQITTLKQQQLSFYQDLNARLTRLSSSSAPAATQTPAVVQAPTAVQAVNSNQSQSQLSLYQTAFHQLQDKQYANAITIFKQYLTKYPTGLYAANCYYWLGEIYSLKGNNTLAIQQLNTIITKYPASNKTPDAMFKIALIQFNSGKKQQAQQILKKVKQQFPGTTAARLAAAKLNTFSKAGSLH